ncbi:MAG TPA: hypothetical protein VNL69_13110 [Bacteroidota bacterium]|nr:hypothetical protein [Bacteroidota bacterium]
MNRLIFQLGILGFCVSAVIFGANGGTLVEIVSRSFLVFVGIVLAAVMIVVIGGTMLENSRRRHEPSASPQSPPTAAQRQQ